MSAQHHIICVVGARPNFMKMAPILAAFDRVPQQFCTTLLHTGQHYDVQMNQQYFDALGIRQPEINLEVGSGSHAMQTAQVMQGFEPVLDAQPVAAVLVVGDVNSTLACALVAAKKQIPVIHVEAGLRSFDRTMPEEMNRILTDQMSDLLFTTERDALQNLLNEGISADKVHFVGNVMIDSLHHNLAKAIPVQQILAEHKLQADMANGYAVLTMHRPSNVDDPQILQSLLACMQQISRQLPLIFPIHPRTQAKLEQFGLMNELQQSDIICLPPMGYLQILGLMKDAKVVLTDSGGMQEETTALGVPCITMRNNTERPITVTEGTNVVVGQSPDTILQSVNQVITSGGKRGRIPEFWDGQAAQRIIAVLGERLAAGS